MRKNAYHELGIMQDLNESVSIALDNVRLEADLALPPGLQGLVVFAHGSGSSRHSPRNRYVARVLERAGLGTLLTDLLTAEEEQADLATRELRFDVSLLAGRLAGIIDWVAGRPETASLPVCLFGASTGAAAALVAAAKRPAAVRTVVSRGGRPDLAGEALASVEAPVLLIVGGRDKTVLQLNRQAMRKLGDAHLEVVLGATHLFEEEGALERVAWLAKTWFLQHTAASRRSSSD